MSWPRGKNAPKTTRIEVELRVNDIYFADNIVPQVRPPFSTRWTAQNIDVDAIYQLLQKRYHLSEFHRTKVPKQQSDEFLVVIRIIQFIDAYWHACNVIFRKPGTKRLVRLIRDLHEENLQIIIKI